MIVTMWLRSLSFNSCSVVNCIVVINQKRKKKFKLKKKKESKIHTHPTSYT